MYKLIISLLSVVLGVTVLLLIDQNDPSSIKTFMYIAGFFASIVGLVGMFKTIKKR